MVTLLDLVADEVQPTFRPVQTESDALFAVAEADVVTNHGLRACAVAEPDPGVVRALPGR